MCSFLLTNLPNVDLQTANRHQARRGPDCTNEITFNGITVVHNLLSMNGAFSPQPFFGDGTICVYNGEIYNSNEFGQFDSDGKCLLCAYEALGPRFVREIDGEFAIAIVDQRNSSLFLASDIFGTKPIHYGFQKAHFGAASYSSALKAIGFELIYQLEPNRYIVIDTNENKITATGSVCDFALDQHKNDFDDWESAFSSAIRKRTYNAREKIFLGLSSGYDSGAICCELDKQNVAYKSYSIMSNERQDIIEDRILRRPMGAEFEFIYPSDADILKGRQWIDLEVEPIIKEIVSTGTGFSMQWKLHEDGAASGLALICQKAAKEGRRIYLSGQGADEIFSDYGIQGKPIYEQSNFGGYFPPDLSLIFPWASFFGSTQAAYLAKEEYVAGSFGIEARYPFLDKNVVQEFLSLTASLKNAKYKSVLSNLFDNCGYPYAANEKLGFVPKAS